MSTQPSLETRITVQERRQTNLEGRVEELSKEMSGSHNNIGEFFDKHSIQLDKIEGDIKVVKGDIAKIESDIKVVKGDITKIEGDIKVVKADITEIKSTMATKNDIAEIRTELTTMATKNDITEVRTELATMNSNMLDILKQLISLINIQRPTPQ